MLDVVWRPRAVADLDGILTYITLELKSPQAAQSTGDAIMQAIEQVATLPETGRVFADEDLHRTYRRILAKHYFVYYSHDDTTLTIWRIFHTSQDHETYGFALLAE